MSGIYKPLIVGFGIGSSILCVWIWARLGLMELSGHAWPLRFWANMKYLFWLIVEIGKADWAVTKVILSKTVEDRQRLISVPTSQKTDLAKVVFANSITLTPGTITVETEADRFIVHALNDEAADYEALEDMSRRVTSLEHSDAVGAS